MVNGISVVVCCYNSAQRLPETLAHLAAQTVPSTIPWEVIIVDNASTDHTANVARASWESTLSAPLRVVHEPQQGLSYARLRGFAQATYDIISFVDDDNWVCPEWVQTVAEIMMQHPQVGACGGCSEAMLDCPPPSWFERYQNDYAVGNQVQVAGVLNAHSVLWGAGLTIRKLAWQQLLDGNFQSLLTGRQGSKLMSSEDYEFCLALSTAGWDLWCDPRLRFRHYLPASRLQWSYLRRLKRGFGASSVGLDPYFLLAQKELAQKGSRSFKALLMGSWVGRMSISVFKLLLKLLVCPHKLLLFSQFAWEGDDEILDIEVLLGRLSELLNRRKVYALHTKAVQVATWRTHRTFATDVRGVTG